MSPTALSWTRSTLLLCALQKLSATGTTLSLMHTDGSASFREEVSSSDRSESRGLAVDESCKDVLGKNRQGRAVWFNLNTLPSSPGAEKATLAVLMSMQLGLSHGICATSSTAQKAAYLEKVEKCYDAAKVSHLSNSDMGLNLPKILYGRVWGLSATGRCWRHSLVPAP